MKTKEIEELVVDIMVYDKCTEIMISIDKDIAVI